jgi:hypothetical protein
MRGNFRFSPSFFLLGVLLAVSLTLTQGCASLESFLTSSSIDVHVGKPSNSQIDNSIEVEVVTVIHTATTATTSPNRAVPLVR